MIYIVIIFIIYATTTKTATQHNILSQVSLRLVVHYYEYLARSFHEVYMYICHQQPLLRGQMRVALIVLYTCCRKDMTLLLISTGKDINISTYSHGPPLLLTAEYCHEDEGKAAGLRHGYHRTYL